MSHNRNIKKPVWPRLVPAQQLIDIAGSADIKHEDTFTSHGAQFNSVTCKVKGRGDQLVEFKPKLKGKNILTLSNIKPPETVPNQPYYRKSEHKVGFNIALDSVYTDKGNVQRFGEAIVAFSDVVHKRIVDLRENNKFNCRKSDWFSPVKLEYYDQDAGQIKELDPPFIKLVLDFDRNTGFPKYKIMDLSKGGKEELMYTDENGMEHPINNENIHLVIGKGSLLTVEVDLGQVSRSQFGTSLPCKIRKIIVWPKRPNEPSFTDGDVDDAYKEAMSMMNGGDIQENEDDGFGLTNVTNS